MRTRRVLEIVIVGLWLTIAAVLALRFGQDSRTVAPVPDVLASEPPQERPADRPLAVRRITVVSADTFDITTADGSRYFGVLPVTATGEARGRVVDLLNNSTEPQVVLRGKRPDGRWLVDLSVASGGKRLAVADWLVSQKLVFK